MRLLRSHDPDHEFDRLTLVIFIFFLIIFFNLIIQHWADEKLNFIIYFDLLCIGLFLSYDPGRDFDRLTQVVF
jgi:hypothetical protein